MAANIASTQTYTVPNLSHLALYGPPYTSPTNSSPTATPLNVSPTSPRTTTTFAHQLPMQTRQLRPPKSPLYRPAVLRPTERPLRPSPMTPPRSSSASIDSRNSEDERRGSVGDNAKTWGLGRVVEVEWMGDEGWGEVTGPPTRAHWKPDSSAPACCATTCGKPFSLFERRHHCRRCGNIFCAMHTSFSVPLDQHATFHPQGYQSRACDSCWLDYQKWDVARRSRSNSEASSDDMVSTPTMGISGGVKRAGSGLSGVGGTGQAGGQPNVGSFTGSVPRDWNWSTF